MVKRKSKRDQQKAMWANIKKREKIPIGIIRSDDPKNWTLIANGSGNPQTPQYGLPFLTITRKDGLALKKQFGLRNDTDRYSRSYIGNISGESFVKTKESAVKVHDYFQKKKQNQTNKTQNTKQYTKKIEPQKQDKKPDFRIVEEIHRQLGSSKVNGFPFYAYTGAKPLAISETSINLTLPRNPNHINKINIDYDKGSDSYNLRFLKGTKIDELKDVYADQLTDIIIDRMGVR